VSRLLTLTQLEEIALVLENERDFYNWYQKRLHFEAKEVREGMRTELRNRADQFSPEIKHLLTRGASLWVHDREILRRHFDKRYGASTRPTDPGDASRSHTAAKLPVLYQDSDPKSKKLAPPFEPKEEPIMNTTNAIEVTTKTLVNGQDVAGMSDSSIYELIAAQEAKIAELDAIKTKPKKLVAEIEKRQAGIAALVAYLDSKE